MTDEHLTYSSATVNTTVTSSTSYSAILLQVLHHLSTNPLPLLASGSDGDSYLHVVTELSDNTNYAHYTSLPHSPHTIHILNSRLSTHFYTAFFTVFQTTSTTDKHRFIKSTGRSTPLLLMLGALCRAGFWHGVIGFSLFIPPELSSQGSSLARRVSWWNKELRRLRTSAGLLFVQAKRTSYWESYTTVFEYYNEERGKLKSRLRRATVGGYCNKELSTY